MCTQQLLCRQPEWQGGALETHLQVLLGFCPALAALHQGPEACIVLQATSPSSDPAFSDHAPVSSTPLALLSLSEAQPCSLLTISFTLK
jgi:hypothetical protein